ncbi:hypothetical protein GUU_00852, partial [Malacoplasma iowae 695]
AYSLKIKAVSFIFLDYQEIKFISEPSVKLIFINKLKKSFKKTVNLPFFTVIAPLGKLYVYFFWYTKVK